MVIRIGRRTLEDIFAHAASAYPEECCGVLIAGSGSKDVVGSVKMRNAFSGPRHDRYNIDPMELFRAGRDAAGRGLAIAGVYHSHPDHPATLSTFDIEHSFPWYSYLVVSVPGGRPGDARSWVAGRDRRSAAEEEIEIRDGEAQTA
ncbi:MAG: M67 family metallopeptidase [Nitrososphaerota archaeon]|nr:M67 family metallopeptidase [Nitrososphaerota archaeon]